MSAEPSAQLWVPGPIVGKGRPRVTLQGHVYTPAATRAHELRVRAAALLAMGGRPPLEGPLLVQVYAHLQPPESWSGWEASAALEGLTRPTSKPDLDNIVKAALDACNKVLWNDDAQIVEICAGKTYSTAAGLQVLVYARG